MLELPPEPEPELELDAFNKLGRNGGVGRRQLMVQLAVKDLMALVGKSQSSGICAIHLPFVLPFLALGAADAAAAAVVAADAAAAAAAATAA